MVSEDFVTRLQAMSVSGDIEGYLCSQISKIDLEPDWIIQGITHNGLEGRIDTEKNQRKYLIPMDLAVRLMIDEGIDPAIGLGILILGPIGLTERKFVVLLRGFPQHLEAIAFQTSGKYNPQDIARLMLKFELNEELSTRFVEPLSDYVEQIQIDSSEDRIIEALSLQMPTKKFHAPDWIREASSQRDSEHILFSFGDLNQLPPFSLLFTSWCLGLDLYKITPDLLVTMILIGKNTGRVAIWDGQRRIASFLILKNKSLEEIARRYLLSLWSSGQENVGPPIKTREVVIGSQEMQTTLGESAKTDRFDNDQIVQLQKNIADLRKKLDQFSISELLIRLENIEAQLTSPIDTMPAIVNPQSQERLKRVIARLEAIAKRLEELDNRIEQVSSKSMG